uniref:Uncharacterized protein n=1 Tax=Knipowitschia caucasica TaxID=637954 RepID=A0AAV2L5Y9_KNICA
MPSPRYLRRASVATMFCSMMPAKHPRRLPRSSQASRSPQMSYKLRPMSRESSCPSRGRPAESASPHPTRRRQVQAA